MNQKGFINIASVIVIAALAVLIAGGGVYLWQKSSFNKEVAKQSQRAQEENQKLQQKVNDLQNQIAQLQAQKETPASKEETPSQPIGTEKAMGYIKAVYDKNGKSYLDIDYVQWLSGKDAIKAAIEDGKCFVGENTSQLLNELENLNVSAGLGKFAKCTPDGYYIRNQNPQIRTFEISKNVEITMQTYASGQCYVQWNEKVSYTTFKSFWGTNPACTHLKSLPYNIEAQNGIITKITEQYIP